MSNPLEQHPSYRVLLLVVKNIEAKAEIDRLRQANEAQWEELLRYVDQRKRTINSSVVKFAGTTHQDTRYFCDTVVDAGELERYIEALWAKREKE